MKEGWEYKKLGECFISINNGANIKQIKGAKGIPITRIETLSNDKFNRERMGYADILDASPYSSYILNDGDILMSHINSMKYLGRAVQYLKNEDETIIHGMNLLRLVPTKDVLSSFLIYQFFTAFFRNQIVSISHQSVNQASFNTTNLKNLKLKVPSLSEQQSIVDYLDSAFAKIDAMKANAEKALNEAKALFQASLKEMLEPKEGWEEKKVGDIAEIKGGKRLPKGEKLLSEPTNHKYIRVADFNEYGTVDLDDIQYISDKVYEQIKRYIIKKEDIYISIAGTIGKSGMVPEELDGANLTENACRLILSKDISQKFMYYTTISPEFIRQEIESTKISAQPKLALTRLADISIAFPSIVEQETIADTLDSLKSKVDRLQENYDKISQECDALKQAILRQVFE